MTRAPVAKVRDAAHVVALPPRSDTVDRYLETIYCIAAEGQVVRPGRVADWLGVSAPTVSVALQRLARDGWIIIAANRSVTLTALGDAAAQQLIRRHRLLERWLTDVLGFDWASADVEAERLAGSVSDDVLERLDESMQMPSTCPHGNVIPGRRPPYGELTALAELQPGVTATVQRISEVAEHEARPLLRELASHGVHIGTAVRVDGPVEPHGPFVVSVAGHRIHMSDATARLIWVDALS